MTTNLILGADLSHYQSRPDFDKLVADGVQYVILKATQGMSVDPDFDWNRNEAAKRNLPWLPYPFLTPTDTPAAVSHFCKVVGAKVPPAFDWEEHGTPAADVEHWKAGCEDLLGRTGLAYYGISPPAPVTDIIAEMLRWLPEYTNGKTRIPMWDGTVVPTDWRDEWFIWQFTGNGRLPDVPGDIDLNRLSCPFEVFKHWYDTGELLPWAVAPDSGNVPAPALIPIIPLGRVLHLHSSGEDVRALQRRLAWLGGQVSVDGDYGPQTVAAVEDFQVAHGLHVDGVAGTKQTIPAINAAQP